MKKIYWLWMILLVCCYGCKKEEAFIYETPSIRLLGAEVVGANQGELKVRVDLGAGFSQHKAWIQLMDISDASGKTTTQSVALTQEEVQELTISVRPPVAGNDYQVMAVLETEKNRFETNKQFLFFSQKSHRYDIGQPYIIRGGFFDRPFLEGNVYAIRQNGEYFTIDLSNEYPFSVSEVKVLLNGSIPLECDYNPIMGNTSETILAKVPMDLAPGDYSATIYLDGEKWDVQGILRVLPWQTEMVDVSAGNAFSYYTISSSFVFDDEIVYVQYKDRSYAESYTEFKVWSYHIPSNTWKEKNSWIPTDDGNPITGVALDGVGYSVLQHNYKACLWSYTPETDEWKRLSDYPGQGVRGFMMFAIDGFIYLGGGMHQKDMYDNQVGVSDFWRYDIQTQQWEQLGDLPFTPETIYSVNSTCLDGHKAYTFFYDRTLWSYDSTTDLWSQEAALCQGPYFRYFASLCMWEGKVCLIGGLDEDYNGLYTDIQLYDPATRQWTLKGIYEYSPYMSTAYTPSIHQQQGEIWVGPLQLWGTYDQPAPQFLKIKTR